MSHPTTLGIDFGGNSIKFGVVQDGRIIRHGNVVPTRQDGEIELLIRSIVDEILRLKQAATEMIKDELWLKESFIPIVQQRGAAIIKARGASSAASAANAAIDTVWSLSFWDKTRI